MGEGWDDGGERREAVARSERRLGGAEGQGREGFVARVSACLAVAVEVPEAACVCCVALLFLLAAVRVCSCCSVVCAPPPAAHTGTTLSVSVARSRRSRWLGARRASGVLVTLLGWSSSVFARVAFPPS